MSVRLAAEGTPSAGIWIGTHGRNSKEKFARASNRKYLFERLARSRSVKVQSPTVSKQESTCSVKLSE
jgi:hypothetical protein